MGRRFPANLSIKRLLSLSWNPDRLRLAGGHDKHRYFTNKKNDKSGCPTQVFDMSGGYRPNLYFTRWLIKTGCRRLAGKTTISHPLTSKRRSIFITSLSINQLSWNGEVSKELRSVPGGCCFKAKPSRASAPTSSMIVINTSQVLTNLM